VNPADQHAIAQLPEATRRTIARLNQRAWGFATGMLFGGGLFLATLVLVLKQGPNMGQHLSVLSVFMPGYSVSVVGALIGFGYAFIVGYVLGRVMGAVYGRTRRER